MNNIMQKINKLGLCCACGACKHVCPFDNIEMQYDEVIGRWEANVLDEKICTQCSGKCLTVCPSHENNLERLNDYYQDDLGQIAEVVTGWSENKEIRCNSSSGGFVKAISKLLLTQHHIDGIIALKFASGYEYYPYLYKTEDEIDLMPNSIYHQVNFEKLFEILKNEEGNFLIIGLPCHFIALELFLQNRQYQKLRSKVYGRVSLICGYTFDRILRNAFVHYKNMEGGIITSYREAGRYRKTRISAKSKSFLYDIKKPKNINDYIDNQMLMDKSMVQKACLYCIDHLGACADLAVGDAWLKRYEKDNHGSNIIIVRNNNGKILIDLMKKFYFEKATKVDILESQGVRYAYGTVGHYLRNQMDSRHQVPQHVKPFCIKKEINDIYKKNEIKRLLIMKKYWIAKVKYFFIQWKQILKMQVIIIIKKVFKGEKNL